MTPEKGRVTASMVMTEALNLAREAYHKGETPVGAVVVRNGAVVGRGRNRREEDKNALCHAEIEAIAEACKTLGGWRLADCDLYVTLEPCPMCAGAIINARIRKVWFGAYDDKNGAAGSIVNLFEQPFTHKPLYEGGVCEHDCAAILSEFFEQLRKNNI